MAQNLMSVDQTLCNPLNGGAGGGRLDGKGKPYLEYVLILAKENCCPLQSGRGSEWSVCHQVAGSCP